MLRVVSDIFFFVGFSTLLVAIVLFDLGTRALKKKNEMKKRVYDRKGKYFLFGSIVSFGISFLFAFLSSGR